MKGNKNRRYQHYYNPNINERQKRILYGKTYAKKSKLWQEVEALFWALAFKEDIERDLPQGCTWVQKAPGCP